MQYKIGTVSVTNGSPTVIGEGVDWSGLSTPLYFKIDADGAPVYEVATIDPPNKEITLAANYQGSTQSGLKYQLVQDFSNNLGIVLPSQGDADSGDWLRRSFVEIDQWLFGPKWGANTETLTENKTLAITSARLQFLNASGANRDVNLPAEADGGNYFFIIFETGGNYSLVVKDDTPATVITIPAGKAGLVACNGIIWKGLLGG